MAALPSVSGERAVRVFQKAGWVKDRQRYVRSYSGDFDRHPINPELSDASSLG